MVDPWLMSPTTTILRPDASCGWPVPHGTTGASRGAYGFPPFAPSQGLPRLVAGSILPELRERRGKARFLALLHLPRACHGLWLARFSRNYGSVGGFVAFLFSRLPRAYHGLWPARLSRNYGSVAGRRLSFSSFAFPQGQPRVAVGSTCPELWAGQVPLGVGAWLSFAAFSLVWLVAVPN